MSKIKPLFHFLLLFIGTTAKANNYYVDPSSTSVIQNGQFENPWRRLDSVNANMGRFKGGDTIFFKKGGRFIGKLKIECSGSAGVPVVFTTYGKDEASPLFQYRLPDPGLEEGRNTITILKSQYIVVEGLKITDTTMNSKDHSLLTNVGYAVQVEDASYVSLKNLDISLVGIGVSIKGDNNVLYNCIIHNLRMIVNNTTNSDDDYGAVAVVLSGSGNEIKNNLFLNCQAVSSDYGFDGGGVEVFGSAVNENRITENTVMGCNGFMEFGSNSGGFCNNTLITKNLLINNSSLFYIHEGGKFSLSVSNLQFSDNKIIETSGQFTKPGNLISTGSGTSAAGTKNMISMKNNIFWLSSGVNLVSGKRNFYPGQLLHEGNIYYLEEGSLNYEANTTEYVITGDTPSLQKTRPGFQSFSKIYRLFFKCFRSYLMHCM